MALPTLLKSWIYDVNVAVTSDERNIQRVLKDRQKAIGGWAVDGSCDGTTAGMDAVDRWLLDTHIIFSSIGGQPRSWIVIRQVATGAQYCLWFNRDNAFWPDRIFSAGGLFTGGSTTTRPTATDEIIFDTGWSMMHDTSVSQRLHIIQSTDGKNAHIFVTGDIGGKNYPAMTLMMGQLSDAEPGLSHPYYFYASNDNTFGNHGAKVMFDNQNFCAYDTVLGARNDISLATERPLGVSNDWLGDDKADDISGLWVLLPVSLWRGIDGIIGAPKSRYGVIPDFYLTAKDASQGPPNGLLAGTGFPADGSRQFIVVAGYAVPWGSKPAMQFV